MNSKNCERNTHSITHSAPNRRAFLAAGAATVAGISTFSINALGANEKIVLGLMGVRNRGMELSGLFCSQPNADLAFLADPDSTLFRHASRRVEAMRDTAPTCEQDFRRLLDNKDIDAIVMATPDHWHALGTILACQAGKDVYVEKPVCHSIWEGQQMMTASKQYGRVVSVGLQNRSMPCVRAARERIRSGALGEIHYVRIMNNKARPPLTGGAEIPTPEGIDYDMWLGPADMRPFSSHHFHYNWHWFWQYSGGDIMNDGIHQIDIVRFLLDLGHAERVYATGGKFFFEDAQETPDTQSALFDFPGLTVSLEQALWTRYMRKDPHEFPQLANTPWQYNGTRIELYGTREHLVLARHGGGWEAFDARGESIHREPSHRADEVHVKNFLDCIRTREEPTTTVQEGFLSTLMCIQGNISHRLGRALQVDKKTDLFVDDHEANTDFLARRTYRDPWRIPELQTS